MSSRDYRLTGVANNLLGLFDNAKLFPSFLLSSSLTRHCAMAKSLHVKLELYQTRMICSDGQPRKREKKCEKHCRKIWDQSLKKTPDLIRIRTRFTTCRANGQLQIKIENLKMTIIPALSLSLSFLSLISHDRISTSSSMFNAP